VISGSDVALDPPGVLHTAQASKSRHKGEPSRAKACGCRTFLRIIEARRKLQPVQFNMSPEGESSEPEDEDVDTEDLEWDKTEGDEASVKKTDDEGA
jgi:hypothetical protein